MNYRHAYHAGNFGDVLKHAVLALVIAHLKQKEAPFRVIDTHAGIARYQLDDGPAEKTGEWRDGIARLWGPSSEPLPPAITDILAPYLAAVAAENDTAMLTRYPGSPRVARFLMRPGDRLIVNELHPEDQLELKAVFARDKQTKTLALDGWMALKALLPPKERRGVVLIDPPFEKAGELDRLATGIEEAARRFSSGIYLLWYPIKDPKPIAKFHQALTAGGHAKLLVAELFIRSPRNPDTLNGCGLAILNPPFRLEETLETLLPFLAERLAMDEGATHRLFHLSDG